MVAAPLLIALIASAPDTAAEARRLFAEGIALRGNPVEARQRFRAAAETWQILQSQGIHNAALYRSEGNAWLLADEVPRAILAYRRGLRHSPSDAALRAGLEAAQKQVATKAAGGLGQPPVEQRPPWLPRVSFSWWSFALVLLVYALGWLSLARWLMVRRQALLVGAVGCLLVSTLLTVVLGLASLYEERANAFTLVVIAGDDVPLRRGNGFSYSAHPQKLPRGAEAKLLFQRGDWLQIELSSGEIGWVPLSAALVDAATEPG